MGRLGGMMKSPMGRMGAQGMLRGHQNAQQPRGGGAAPGENQAALNAVMQPQQFR
jgi:hypothetical protein